MTLLNPRRGGGEEERRRGGEEERRRGEEERRREDGFLDLGFWVFGFLDLGFWVFGFLDLKTQKPKNSYENPGPSCHHHI